VTRVKVIGKANDDGRSSVDAIVDGDLRYGVLQEIIRRDDNKDIAAAKAEAETILKERGEPEETNMVTVPDLPFIRRGDTVDLAVGNFIGLYSVLGVSHNATQRLMTLSIMKYEPKLPEPATGGGSPSNNQAGTFAVGDAIILNGFVYVDSFGTGRGRYFTDYHSTITIVAPLTRATPYHVGSIGWVFPESLTRR